MSMVKKMTASDQMSQNYNYKIIIKTIIPLYINVIRQKQKKYVSMNN